MVMMKRVMGSDGGRCRELWKELGLGFLLWLGREEKRKEMEMK